MSRGLTSDVQTEIAKARLRLCFLVRLSFDSQTLRLTSNQTPLQWDAGDGAGVQTWTALGNCAGISFPPEPSDLSAGNVTLTLAGVDPAYVALALEEPYQNRRVRIWKAVFDTSGAILADPLVLFDGFMDAMSLPAEEKIGPGLFAASVVLQCESELAMLDRPLERRWNQPDQQQDYPADRGFEYQQGLNGVPIEWGGGLA